MSNGRGTVSNTDDNTFKSSDREYHSAIAKHLSLNVECASYNYNSHLYKL